MGADTKIEWTDHTFNAWIGCTKVSPACDHCYAESWAHRYGSAEWGPGNPRLRTSGANWRQPLKWDREAAAAGVKRFVFCNSLADVFDNEVDPAWRRDLWDLIIDTPNLVWLLLTKRVGNVERLLPYMPWADNAWLGATVVNQAEADRDIPKLLAAKAKLGIPRVFLSIEPMLGAINLNDAFYPPCQHEDSSLIDPETGCLECSRCDDGDYDSVNWVICGGESGKYARPMHPDWARSLRDQCAAAGVPFLFKQWGEWFPYGHVSANGNQNSRTMGERPGVWHDWGDGNGMSVRIGKKEAGRYLDGVEHNGRPQP